MLVGEEVSFVLFGGQRELDWKVDLLHEVEQLDKFRRAVIRAGDDQDQNAKIRVWIRWFGLGDREDHRKECQNLQFL